MDQKSPAGSNSSHQILNNQTGDFTLDKKQIGTKKKTKYPHQILLLLLQVLHTSRSECHLTLFPFSSLHFFGCGPPPPCSQHQHGPPQSWKLLLRPHLRREGIAHHRHPRNHTIRPTGASANKIFIRRWNFEKCNFLSFFSVQLLTNIAAVGFVGIAGGLLGLIASICLLIGGVTSRVPLSLAAATCCLLLLLMCLILLLIIFNITIIMTLFFLFGAAIPLPIFSVVVYT